MAARFDPPPSAALLLLACFLTAPAPAQSPEPTPEAAAAAAEVANDVRQACEHRKLAIRIAAARKAAAAGDAAVPTVRAYVEAHGRNALSLPLVEAFARPGSGGAATFDLLLELAQTRDFYWRAKALEGLVDREPARLRPFLREAVADPSGVYRVQAARGLWRSWRSVAEGDRDTGAERDRAAVRQLLADPDPRVRVDVAAFLLAAGEVTAAPVLRVALARQGEGFLGDPWGQRLADTARKALRAAGVAETSASDPVPAAAVGTDGVAWTGGVEVRSCQHGDLFVRWNAAGEVGFGLDLERRVGLEPTVFAPFARALAELPPADPAVHGAIVCDFVRVAVAGGASGAGANPSSSTQAWQRHDKAAPGAVPADVEQLLQLLADTLEKAGAAGDAQALRTRLDQFTNPTLRAGTGANAPSLDPEPRPAAGRNRPRRGDR